MTVTITKPKETKPKFFIGIDISKLTLDVSLLSHNYLVEQFKIDNTEAVIRKLLLELREKYAVTGVNSLFCCENMGIFQHFLLNVLLKKKIKVCVESPLQIKKSLGIQRGKKDALDATRIAKYASKHYSQLRIWRPPRKIMEDLKRLSSLRKRLIKIRVMLSGNMRLQSYYLQKSELKKIDAYTSFTKQALDKDIAKIESDISQIIKKDSHLSRLMEIVSSVPRIGPVIATEMILITNEFEASWTARKFACYAGVAPFDYSSGTSVKGRSKVSLIANKEMKSLLHLAALGTVRMKKTFLGRYYARKVKEGKHKMKVLNAIRNKLIRRVFSCVRNDHPFKEKYRQSKSQLVMEHA